MGRANFSQATQQLADVRLFADDSGYRTLERLERVVLEHTPRSPHEAVAMLDIVIPEVLAGGRTDGRDVTALANIRTLLSTL